MCWRLSSTTRPSLQPCAWGKARVHNWRPVSKASARETQPLRAWRQGSFTAAIAGESHALIFPLRPRRLRFWIASTLTPCPFANLALSNRDLPLGNVVDHLGSLPSSNGKPQASTRWRERYGKVDVSFFHDVSNGLRCGRALGA